MKTDKILVGANGATLALTSGKQAKAIYPAGKGEKTSYLLMTDGKLAPMKGSRINGVGVARYFAEHGFEPAKPGDADADELASMVDAIEGTVLVERANLKFASQLSAELAGKTCTFVPFASDKPVASVTVDMPRGITSLAFDLASGFTSGIVQIEYRPQTQGHYGSGVRLSDGWLVSPEGNQNAVPRSTEYGGVVELAVFVICNSGLGDLIGEHNLDMDEDAALDARYPRGKLTIQLKNGDHLTAGVDAVDELGVRYTRNGQIVYNRERAIGNHVNALKLGSVVGAIAAVLVRVQELDEAALKAPRARAQKAA